MPKKKPKKRKPKVVTTAATPPDSGPIRSLRRDPFEVPKGIPPAVKRVTIKKIATDQSDKPHVPPKPKRKKPLVPKRGRQKRRGATRTA